MAQHCRQAEQPQGISTSLRGCCPTTNHSPCSTVPTTTGNCISVIWTNRANSPCRTACDGWSLNAGAVSPLGSRDRHDVTIDASSDYHEDDDEASDDGHCDIASLVPPKRRRLATGKSKAMEGNVANAKAQTSGCGAGHRISKICQHSQGCDKATRISTLFCTAHGGGQRCQYPDGCCKSAIA
jgi:hypothetical protein